jgi:hypothetical protein
MHQHGVAASQRPSLTILTGKHLRRSHVVLLCLREFDPLLARLEEEGAAMEYL